MGTIPHQQQRHRPLAQGLAQGQQLLHILLRRQTPYKQQHHPPGRNVQAGPQHRLCHGVPWAPEPPQVDTAGNHQHRTIYAVAQQQMPHLAGGGNDAVGLADDPAAEGRRRPAAPADAGGEVVGIVLIHRVISVDQRYVQLLGNAPGQEEGGELTLGVDHIRAPLHQFPHPAARQGSPQPGTGVDTARSNGAQAGDPRYRLRPQIRRQGQYPYLMAQGLQLPPQIVHGSNHTVYCRRVPVCGDENFHNRASFGSLISITVLDGDFLQLCEILCRYHGT